MRKQLIALTETEKLARANARRQLGGGAGVQQAQPQAQQPQPGGQQQQQRLPSTASATGAELIVRAMAQMRENRARQAIAAAGQPPAPVQRPALLQQQQQPVTQQLSMPLRDDTQQLRLKMSG